MKKAKILFTLLILLKVCAITAQLATTDPGLMGQNSVIIGQNSQMISTAILQFKQLQQDYQLGKQSFQQFVQMKDFIQASEDRLKNIGGIKDLKLNDINLILDQVFCLKETNYFPVSIQFLDIINRIKAGFLNCNNQDIYNSTFSGLLAQLDARSDAAYDAGSTAVSAQMDQLSSGVMLAANAQSAMNSYDTRMKLELGLKYKAISDQLMQLSEELHLAINMDGTSDKNIKLSPADRMKMMDMANQYQMQALEYEEKSSALLKQASQMDEQQQEKLIEVKRDLGVQQMINFNL